MTQQDPTPPGFPREGLGLLLDHLARDGWLVGLNTDPDPTLARMDPKTGVYRREYLHQLLEEAVTDARALRSPRLLDGPDPGRISMISIRIVGWERILLDRGEQTRTRLEVEAARRLASCLRAEDALGRTRADTFTLLLRGCPPDQVAAIAKRCCEVIEEPPTVTDTGPVHLTAVAATTQWEQESATDFAARAMADIGRQSAVEV